MNQFSAELERWKKYPDNHDGERLYNPRKMQERAETKEKSEAKAAAEIRSWMWKMAPKRVTQLQFLLFTRNSPEQSAESLRKEYDCDKVAKRTIIDLIDTEAE